MPIEEERRLRAQARKEGIDPQSERGRAYVYGTLTKIKKRRQEKRKNAERK